MLSHFTIPISLFAALALSACAARRPPFVQQGEASYHDPFFLSPKARTASGEHWWNFKS